MNFDLILVLAALVAIFILGAVAVRALGGNITVVDDWKKAWKWYSTYALALVAFLPEIFNALLAGDYLGGAPVSDDFSFWLKAAAAGTFVLRTLKQVPKPEAPTFDDTDRGAA